MVKIDTRNIGTFREEDFSKTLLYQSSRTRVLLLCFEPGQEMPPHHCSFEIVWYILEGEGVFTMDGKEQLCAKQSLIVTPSHTTRGFRADGRTRMLLFLPRIQGIPITASPN